MRKSLLAILAVSSLGNTFGCYSRMYDLLAQKAEEKDEKSIV